MQRSFWGGSGLAVGAALAIACCVPLGVSAQTPEQPVLAPTRDVTVTYRLTGGNTAKVAEKMSITFTKQGERVRLDYFHWVESKTPYTSLVFDRPANRDIAVMEERRGYVERDTVGLANPASYLNKSMQFTRLGTVTVAGTACTDWRVKAEEKASDGRTVCVTEDGVLLRLVAAPPGDQALTATEVSYGSPPDSIFEAPADFTRLKQRTPQQR